MDDARMLEVSLDDAPLTCMLEVSLDDAPLSLRYLLVRFEVSMDDALTVDVLQGQNSLSKVLLRHLHCEAANVLQERG